MITSFHCSAVILCSIAVAGDAGVVDDDVDRPEVALDLLQAGGAGGGVADVPL